MLPIALAVLLIIGGVAWYLSEHHSSSTPRSTPTSTPSAPPNSSVPSPANAFNVVTYGADPSGRADSTLAIRRAVAAALTKGGNQTVYFPAGTYLLNDGSGAITEDGVKVDVPINGANGSVINILGAGENVTKVIDEVGVTNPAYPGLRRGDTAFVFKKMNGFYFSGLTVDAATYTSGDTLDVYGSDSTIENSDFLGANETNPHLDENTFDIRVLSPKPNSCNLNSSAPGYTGDTYATGNTVKNVSVSGEGFGYNDDLDFSCQHNGTLSNIVDTGWGTAIYIDENVTVNGYIFRPGPRKRTYPGYVITDSRDITINDFTTSGNGGVISVDRLLTNHKIYLNYPSSDIVINGERMTTPGFVLQINDASDVAINNSTLTGMALTPLTSISDVTLTNSSAGPVTCSPRAGSVRNALFSDSGTPAAPITGLHGISC
jgi:hypothetical protein